MDASKKKAFLKSRMREAVRKRGKRIESPFVRYDDLGQPVCRVCNLAIKSEAFWPAHAVSRSHNEAADRLKAQAKGTTITPCPGSELNATVTTKAKETAISTGNGSQLDSTVATNAKPRVSSSLPDDFWDQPQAKRASTGPDVATQGPPLVSEDTVVESRSGKELASNDVLARKALEPARVVSKAEVHVPQPGQDGAVMKKGAQNSLPQGFFDNVEADYRARGLEPPKYNIQDEWKDFEKSVRDDLQEVDLRLEEEEFDAAEDREQLESLQQRELLDRVEKLKRKEHENGETTEITEVIAKVASRKPFMNVNLSLDEDSSSDEDSEDDNALLDWRAKQF